MQRNANTRRGLSVGLAGSFWYYQREIQAGSPAGTGNVNVSAHRGMPCLPGESYATVKEPLSTMEPASAHDEGRTAPAEAGEVARLIARVRGLDREAFTSLYRLTVTPVYRYLSARLNTVEEAEDLTQEVFIAALGGIQGLRARDETGLLAWLFQIARHKLADRLRQRYRRPVAPLEDAEKIEAPTLRPEEMAEAVEERLELRGALERLTPEQREVIVCKYVLGYDNDRTARLVGKNVNAVNQLHHRALNSLQRLLTQQRTTG